MSLEELAEQVSGQLWTLKLNELKEVCLRAKSTTEMPRPGGREEMADIKKNLQGHQQRTTQSLKRTQRRHVLHVRKVDRVINVTIVSSVDLQDTFQEGAEGLEVQLTGQLQPVKAIYPANAQPLQTEIDSVNPVQHQNKELWEPPVALDHLTPEQQDKVRAVLREECHAFSKGDQDVGCIPSLKLKIRLKDTTPVTRTYTSVPKPLHKEVKEYLEDLLNRGWIQKSRSPYSSPLVCVRKKDGTLRLCVDYRELNLKSIPDRHPIPRVQDILNSLCGSAWFSVLDQGKAYHQGFLEEESRPLTAFITPWGLYEWVRIPLAFPQPQQNSSAAWRNV
ncbi:hypothetical protein WMY93_000125 [Mugilogobius chulae]|uniref:ribonuclease H n=1 Tax=Mugilogobius chulae TaxID=88201 RepID=A0AAW0Q958_9GOBI